MTYCAAMTLDAGLIFMSDSRTNAGIDNISTVKKLFSFEVPGERSIVLMSSGNLATTQAVVSLLEERSKAPHERSPSILETPSMFQTARLVANTLREVMQEMNYGPAFSASLILGGQIMGTEPRLFLIYPEGNFIETTDDTPFFQIGEHKYGRPILNRAYDRTMSFEQAGTLLLISFDSTLRSNLSVGLPIDMIVYHRNSFRLGPIRRFNEQDQDFQDISNGWSDALRQAFSYLPPIQL